MILAVQCNRGNMPRAIRYMLPGEIYHLTHRCHNKEFLLRFACDRTEYCKRLRQGIHDFRIALFNYSVTKNHTHLLATANRMESISEFIRDVDGGFAARYNTRKGPRTNAFWGDRFHATMIESGDHLLNCMAYIDLNMVRAGAVQHPEEWPWCGYNELMGRRVRNLVLDLEPLVALLGLSSIDQLRSEIDTRIRCAIAEASLERQRCWTEGIAVGSESYVSRISTEIFTHRRHPKPVLETTGAWVVYERQTPYFRENGAKNRD